MISKKSLFEWLSIVSIVFIMAGCASDPIMSVEWHKGWYKYEPIVESETIHATVRVEVKSTFQPRIGA